MRRTLGQGESPLLAATLRDETRLKTSYRMSRIRSTNTRPERLVRSYLHRHGFRFRIHDRRLRGRPDIVLPKYGAVVMVHGCFWHQHPQCRNSQTPKDKTGYWRRKLARNVARDAENEAALRAQGWRVFSVWECSTSPNDLAQLVGEIVSCSGSSYPAGSKRPLATKRSARGALKRTFRKTLGMKSE